MNDRQSIHKKTLRAGDVSIGDFIKDMSFLVTTVVPDGDVVMVYGHYVHVESGERLETEARCFIIPAEHAITVWKGVTFVV